MEKIGCKNIDREQVKKSVECIWEASKLNPSWGSREQVTVKFVVADYGESGFKPETINYHNKYKSVDMGELEINSVHWLSVKGKKTEWERFCKENGLRPEQIAYLFDTRINTMFAAHLNEIFCKYHQRTYSYSGRWDKDLMYQILVKDIDDVPQTEVAEK